MAPKDHRPDDRDRAGGSAGAGSPAGKRTLTQGIGQGVVQKKDASPLGFDPEPKWKLPDGGLPKDLQPVEATPVSDDIAAFRRALDAGDRDGAMNRWHNTKVPEQIRWSEGATVERELGQIKRLLGTYLLQIMADTGLTFAKRPQLLREILSDTSAKNDWLAGLAQHAALWDDFLATLPDRDAMTDAEGATIGKLMLRQDSLAVMKKLFAHVYAPLRDDSYDPDTVRTRPWKREWIERLYHVISSHLPRQHVRTVRDFAIGYEEKEKGETKWKPLHYAWWSSSRHVILNESSAKDGGSSHHNMTGGSKKDGHAINHFDVGALHEVGHGVGQEMGGNAWALAHPLTGWKTNQSEDEWSKGLWGSDGDMKQHLWDKLGEKADVLDASEARKYLAHRIANKAYTVTTAGFRRPQDVEAFIRKHYRDQKLTRYWERVMAGDRKDMYAFNDDDNVGADDRVYVYLTRSDGFLSSYNAEARRQKVSTYSMSSPLEWFAEQYAHYYRMSPHGQGLDAATKAKLDELHGKKFTDPNGLLQPGEGGAAGDSKHSEGAGDRAGFPW